MYTNTRKDSCGALHAKLGLFGELVVQKLNQRARQLMRMQDDKLAPSAVSPICADGMIHQVFNTRV